MRFDIEYALTTIPIILSSLGLTLLVAILSSFGASVLGIIWEILRRTNRFVEYGIRFVVDCIRSTPIIAQIYFLYFVLPYYGIRIPALVVGILCLSIYYSGYLAEVFRAGIDMIPKGQSEAATALGLTFVQSVIFVMLPQMLRNIAAPWGNYFVSILKSTPYLAVIAVPELLGSALDIGADTFRYAEPMLVVAILFLALAITITHLVSRFERRLMRSYRR